MVTKPAGKSWALTVSEQWMSNDLKVLVLTRHSDPRSGETIYKLQSIVRAEPDRSLFMVPPDYTIREQRVRQPSRGGDPR